METLGQILQGISSLLGIWLIAMLVYQLFPCDDIGNPSHFQSLV